MPGIGGIEATRRIRAAATGETVVVLVSSYPEQDLPEGRARLRSDRVRAQARLREAAYSRSSGPSSGYILSSDRNSNTALTRR